MLSLDPTTTAIASAESEFQAGEKELSLGHREAARSRFDTAVDLLLNVSGGAKRDARLQAAYDGLIDRVGAYESEALRAGDGFSEPRTEPAAIDNLLAVGIAGRPATRTTAELVSEDLEQTLHDLPIQVNDKVLSYIEVFQGNLRSFIE